MDCLISCNFSYISFFRSFLSLKILYLTIIANAPTTKERKAIIESNKVHVTGLYLHIHNNIAMTLIPSAIHAIQFLSLYSFSILQ